ncbi:MAG: mannose-6-phosphate isomerase, class I [Eubacterium sp.]|nr:mannose-6-phosphate isomerase, class I [Eubacterium sp.]
MRIINIKPIFKEVIWGGSRLKTDFGYDIPSDHTGECWAVSAHPDGECRVAGGEYDSMLLSELWNEHRELFGNYPSDRFPLLTKIIDANGDLSIQVHPDDSYAAVNENGSLGKMECWYILDCVENATIIIGHNAKTKEELEDMVRNDRWSELIREVPIKKGDFFQIDPGTVHAIKAGTLILETQQSSDITYRLYDYGRLQNGKPRPLHIDKSLDVIEVPFVERKAYETEESGWMRKLYSCKYYTVWKADLNGDEILKNEYPFMIVSVIEGSAEIDGTEYKKGDHFIVAAGTGDITFKGDAEFIMSAPAIA